MSNPKAILEKIRKLLNLADTSRGGTEAEMETAMRKAQELAMEHNIDLAQVPMGEVKRGAINVGHIIIRPVGKFYLRPVHFEIMQVMQECFGVKLVMNAYRSGSHKFLVALTVIGEQVDMELAQFTWHFLCNVFPRCWTTYSKARNVPWGSFVISRSYYTGLRQGIIATNKKIVDSLPKDQKDKYALVLVDKEALVAAEQARLFPVLRHSKVRDREFDRDAFVSGNEKGKTIKLNNALAP